MRRERLSSKAAAIAFLADTLDWLDLWHGSDLAAGSELDGGRHNAGSNQLFPRL